MNVNLGPGDLPDALVLLVWFAGIASAVFWMVVGWRAMRAHERVAAALERQTTQKS